MKLNFGKHIWIVLMLFAGLLPARAQKQGITGSLYLYNSSGGNPIPLSGYEVYLYDMQSQKWSGPSMTDAYGRYAFYGVQVGRHLIQIYQSETYWRQQVWQQEIQGPGEVKAIVLASVTRIVPHAEYAKIGKDRYNFSLWIDLPEELKPAVQKVSYYLNHPSFSQKVNEVSDPSTGYRFSYTGWGCLQSVYITVYLEDRNIEIEFYMCDGIREAPKK